MEWMETAARQHGVLTRAQVGPNRTSADWLIARGLLRRIAPSVYVVVAAADTPEHRAWVAALASRGTLGGLAAGYLWNLHDTWPDEPLVYVPKDCGRCAVDGVRVVRRDLPPKDCAEQHGLPVTNRTVTALDMISELPLTEALPFADRALQQRWFSREAAERRLRGRLPGNPRLREVMRLVGPGDAESEAERLAHRALRDAGITGWTAGLELWIEGIRVVVDIAFPELGLAIEIDGFAYHSSGGRFQHDRSRQNLLVSAGWTVLRFTWQDLTERPQTLVEAVSKRLLASG